jgi:hypothetical protein
MAVQSDAQRREGFNEFMRNMPRDEVITITKIDYRAAYDALDQYFSDHAADLNQALPQPARGALSTPEKARLATRVLADRYLNEP